MPDSDEPHRTYLGMGAVDPAAATATTAAAPQAEHPPAPSIPELAAAVVITVIAAWCRTVWSIMT